jgi:hypothetical protein
MSCRAGLERLVYGRGGPLNELPPPILPPPALPGVLPNPLLPVPSPEGKPTRGGALSLNDGIRVAGRFRHKSRAFPVNPAHWGIAAVAGSMGAGFIWAIDTPANPSEIAAAAPNRSCFFMIISSSNKVGRRRMLCAFRVRVLQITDRDPDIVAALTRVLG